MSNRLVVMNDNVTAMQVKARSLKGELNVSSRLLSLLDYRHRRLAISTKDGYTMMPLSQTMYLKSSSNYTHIYFANGESVLTCKTLKYWEQKIAHPFFVRCHNSHLVNKEYVTAIDCNGTNIVLNDVEDIPISRTRKQECLHLLGVK